MSSAPGFGSDIVLLEALPTSDSLIPAGIVLAVLSPLVILLDLPPLIWHIRNRNTAAASLVAWIVLHNFFSFLNLLIWPTDNFVGKYTGKGLCDVEVKFMVARAVALPAATLCIVRALARVMNTNKSLAVPTKAQRRRAAVMDLVWCLGLPVIMMFFHYVVQPNRYFLAGVSGCTPSFWASWLSIILMTLPPLFLSLANAFYASLVLWRIHKYRSAFQSILVSSNTTKSRFLRLFTVSFILTVGLLPVEIYVLTTNLPKPGFKSGFHWHEVHDETTWKIIALYHSAVFYDRWVNVCCGFIVFFLFGMGKDAKKMYCGWLLFLGMGAVFPGLYKMSGQSSSSRATMSESLPQTANSKTRFFGLKGKTGESSISKGSTLVVSTTSQTNPAYPSLKPLPTVSTYISSSPVTSQDYHHHNNNDDDDDNNNKNNNSHIQPQTPHRDDGFLTNILTRIKSRRSSRRRPSPPYDPEEAGPQSRGGTRHASQSFQMIGRSG